MGKMYKSMQGKMIDMDKLMTQNELMPAIGNVRVNARGDELGSGGTIVRKREEVVSTYYENNSTATPSEPAHVVTKTELKEVQLSTETKRIK